MSVHEAVELQSNEYLEKERALDRVLRANFGSDLNTDVIPLHAHLPFQLCRYRSAVRQRSTLVVLVLRPDYCSIACIDVQCHPCCCVCSRFALPCSVQVSLQLPIAVSLV